LTIVGLVLVSAAILVGKTMLNTSPQGGAGTLPGYTAFFPEYLLSAIQTESMVRDLSPIQTTINGTAHGRSTHPKGAAAPTFWITELNVGPLVRNPRFSTRDVRHIQAKTVLRSLTAYVNKGVRALDFYTAPPTHLLGHS